MVPGINIKDNLNLCPEGYRLYFRETLLAQGEVFLGRILVIGNLEQLSAVEGWSAAEPACKMPAKWITEAELEKAQKAGLMAVAPLSVLLTHLNYSLKDSAPALLGLQDLNDMLELFLESHPVVVEEFLEDKAKLRALRKILQNLLAEKISIRDFITILEVVGEQLQHIEKTDLVSELVRLALAKQIIAAHLSNEGSLRGIYLSPQLEEMVLYSLRETTKGLGLSLGKEQIDLLFDGLRPVIETHQPCVLITEPHTRIYWKKILSLRYPGFPVFSTAEITPETRLEVLETVALPKELKADLEKKKSSKKRG